jgi:hypothetical protein
MNRRANLLAFILLCCFVIGAFAQGYTGTTLTGTGISTPVSVGKAAFTSADLGTLASVGNLTGSWSMELKGSSNLLIDLNVRQNGDLMNGRGMLRRGESVQDVVAAGSVYGDTATVFVCPVDSSRVFRMDLSYSDKSISGRYMAILENGGRESGTATGTLNLADFGSEPKILNKGVNPGATSGAFVGNDAKNLGEDGNPVREVKKLSVYKSSAEKGVEITTEGNQILREIS